MWPAFLYGTIVLTHTPTAKMHFHSCEQRGTVVDFKDVLGETGTIQYLVEFKCKRSLLRDWIHQDNARPVGK